MATNNNKKNTLTHSISLFLVRCIYSFLFCLFVLLFACVSEIYTFCIGFVVGVVVWIENKHMVSQIPPLRLEVKTDVLLMVCVYLLGQQPYTQSNKEVKCAIKLALQLLEHPSAIWTYFKRGMIDHINVYEIQNICIILVEC